MNSPNIHQRLYLAKALNENAEGIFDHDKNLDEGSYVHSKGELKKAVKGSKKEIGKAHKKGDKAQVKFWLANKKDAESQMNESNDERGARELHLYADNHEHLQRQRMRPIYKNLVNKMAKGNYDPNKAHKLMMYGAKDAADRYHKEHGHKFDKGTVHKAASHMLNHFTMQAKGGDLNHLLHKKYKGKISEEWGGGFQSSREAQGEVQAGLRADAKRQRAHTLSLLTKVHRGEMTPAQFTRAYKKVGGTRTHKELMSNPYWAKQMAKVSKKPMSEEYFAEEEKVSPSVQKIMDRLKKKALKGARKKARVAGTKPRGDDAYAGKNPKAAKFDLDMVNTGAVAEGKKIFETKDFIPGQRPKEHSPRAKAAMAKYAALAKERKEREAARFLDAIRNAKSVTRLTDHGARDWWRSR